MVAKEVAEGEGAKVLAFKIAAAKVLAFKTAAAKVLAFNAAAR